MAKNLDWLRENYRLTYAGSCLSDLRDEVMAEVGARCPYCQISEPDTLDHHLDKALFQEYAILAENLIPMCYRCNNLRSAVVSDAARGVHLYVDQWASQKHISVVIHDLDRIDLEYNLTPAAGLSPSSVRRLERTFLDLRLLSRFSRQAADLIGQEIDLWASMRHDDVEGLRAYLNRTTARLVNSRGHNNWEAALYDALSRHF